MSFGIGNKIEMRKRALLEAIRFCGGVTAFSRRLKVSRSRASNWCNRPEIEMPYQYAVLTEDLTQVSIERLSPYNEAANKVIRRLRSKDTLPLLYVDLRSIQLGDHVYSNCPYLERSMIIGTNGVLISGLAQLDLQKSLKKAKPQVIVLDLEAIALGERSLKEANLELLISEKVAIGLCLERLIGSYSGKRNDLINEQNDDQIAINKSPCCPGNKVRLDSVIANLVDIGSRDTYFRAKTVYLHGDVEIIQAMDNQSLAVKSAALKIKNLKVNLLNNPQRRKQE